MPVISDAYVSGKTLYRNVTHFEKWHNIYSSIILYFSIILTFHSILYIVGNTYLGYKYILLPVLRVNVSVRDAQSMLQQG